MAAPYIKGWHNYSGSNWHTLGDQLELQF